MFGIGKILIGAKGRTLIRFSFCVCRHLLLIRTKFTKKWPIKVESYANVAIDIVAMKLSEITRDGDLSRQDARVSPVQYGTNGEGVASYKDDKLLLNRDQESISKESSGFAKSSSREANMDALLQYMRQSAKFDIDSYKRWASNAESAYA